MRRLITSLMVLLAGCAVPHHMSTPPISAGPDWPLGWSPSTGQPRPTNIPLIDVAQDNVAATWTCEPTLIDTSTFARQHQLEAPWEGPTERPGKLLPPHKSQKPIADDSGTPNDLRPGGLENLGRSGNLWGFESILQTPWTPPDPSLAVGPDHVLVTVNMAIAWYDKKTGTEQFSARLDSTGNPGFFEDVGAGSFTFDPKCFYDPVAERFVVLALEVYSDTEESWITLAISDDSDPNGIWYKYRTWSVVQNGTQQHWVDYPGLGFDTDAFYVTGNLFGLDDNSGWGGVLYRTIEKAPMLTGDTAVIHDVRKGGHASVQCAQHYGETPLAFFVSRRNSTSLRISRILDHTSPTVSSSNVAVPAQSPPPGAPNPGGVIDTLDGRMLNVLWRDGHLYTCHAIEDEPDAACARWYDIDMNTPASPVLYQSGDINTLSGPGPSGYTYFPAIAANMYGDVAIAVGKCDVDDVPSIQITGRSSDDPLGSMDLLTETAPGSHGADGRYGDYFDMTIDPVDDTTFWYVAEYSRDFGWQTYVGRYTITEPNTCPTDVDGDGVTGINDLLAIIAWWGTQDDSADVNNDGLVDVGDLLECIAAYGPC
ncbi:MAG: hypothetical protein QGI75_01670 [Phycisphaerales bacterium]|nr:hypothetical protein [Phycisphaerales bacterium]